MLYVLVISEDAGLKGAKTREVVEELCTKTQAMQDVFFWFITFDTGPHQAFKLSDTT